MSATGSGNCSVEHRQGPAARWRRCALRGVRRESCDLDAEQLQKATELLNLKNLAESKDIPQFLAIGRGPRTTSSCARPPSCSNLDDLAESADIPQFLAIAREAAERATALRPFDVQLLGALRMLAGDVVEMATGEGKTLAGAIAAAGYALGGRQRARHLRQRLPGPPRRRVDGPAARGDGPDRRLDHRRLDRRRAPRGLRVRRHLRLGQRDRLRRAARPAGHRRRRPGVAEPRRRADRRGRLGARRRGAGAAGAGRHHAPRDAAGSRSSGWSATWSRATTTTPTPTAATSTSPRPAPSKVESRARRHRPVLRGARRHHADRGQRRPARPRAAAARRALHRPRRRGAPDQRLAAAGSRSCSAGPTGCRPPSRPRRASRPPRPARCSTPSPCRR